MMVLFINRSDGVLTDNYVARKSVGCCLCVLDLLLSMNGIHIHVKCKMHLTNCNLYVLSWWEHNMGI